MARTTTLPSHEAVKELLDFNPETGGFTWKPRSRERFKSDRACNAFNAAVAGKPAGYTDDNSYCRIDVYGTSIRAHRLAWFYVHGVWPKEIDHVDGNRLNNAISNLRNVNRRENSRNRCVRSDNTTGMHGVYRDDKPESGVRWTAMISNDEGKRIILGRFVNYEDAVFARKIAEKCFGYHHNHGRAARVEA